LRDGEERSSFGGQGSNEDHTERDGGVEKTTGDSEEDPGVDGEGETKAERDVEPMISGPVP
jgi:hypothetical protein